MKILADGRCRDARWRASGNAGFAFAETDPGGRRAERGYRYTYPKRMESRLRGLRAGLPSLTEPAVAGKTAGAAVPSTGTSARHANCVESCDVRPGKQWPRSGLHE
jgi:hypothetical protein